MVNKIDNINKKKYQQIKNNNKLYMIAIGILVVIMAVVLVTMNMGSNTSVALAGPAPSGNNCPENVAYMQTGADKYKEIVGAYPTDLKELTQVKAGQGPYVEKLPKCPSGNLYVIENGIVKEVAKK